VEESGLVYYSIFDVACWIYYFLFDDQEAYH
jgi:hypothetical protein